MASVPDSSLEAGLAALKQGDYPTAIAHLEVVCQTQRNQTSQIKAETGLVVAYERIGEISRAIALCQILSNSSNPQVREWAVCKQAELKNRYPVEQAADSTAPESDLTGFVAFDNPPSADKNTRRQKNKETKDRINNISAPPAPQSLHLSQWRQAGRAKRWQTLSPVNLIPLWLLQFGTAIALFWLIRELLKFVMAFTNALLVKLPYLEPFQLFYRDPTQFVLFTLGVLLSLSPWLLDKLLQLFYSLQPLSINTLSTHSPEAIRVLQRYCRQRRWSLPQLRILSTSAPVALTYGNLPHTARIVVSQGLLEQLTADEIATIYAGQLGHIAHWDFVVMSLVILVTQLPYIFYQQVSQWGDRRLNAILRSTASAIASLAYGIWWLLSGSAIWLSQLRLYYSDRLAAEITGNPNALTRALLKISQGIALDIQQQGHTSWLLESLNLLTLVDYRQAITLGSYPEYTQLERLLAWDCLNPYRYWLTINNTHPLIGDRLQRLNRIAQHWHLETELNLVIAQSSADSQFNPKSKIQNPKFFLQGAPFFGVALGFAFGCLTWLIGGIGILLEIAQLAWMYGDWVIIKGCLPIGFSIGTFARINFFFPDIKPTAVQTDTRVWGEYHSPSLPEILVNSNALPIDSQPISLKGKLLGRRGISNCLGQDLILYSPIGLVKLHHFSWLGPVGNLLPLQSPSPRELIGQNLITTGWFRRGATFWLDIDILRTQSGKISRSAHPVWSTLLASMAAAWGAYIILPGGG
jgi:Zn-dependent protease with chaperone function